MSNKKAADGGVDPRIWGCAQKWLYDPDGQEATPWSGWASSAFLSLRSVFLWGVLDEKCKDLKLLLNNGLKNMSLYVPILDHQKIRKYVMPQHSSLFIHFGAFGFFFKHWY